MIYLDNAATTQPCAAASEAFLKCVDSFGNPSSLHGLGLETEKLINSAKETLASRLGGIDKKHILFTSGGTEANNLAAFGVTEAMKRNGNRIITSKIEHPSVLEAFKKLEKDGFDVIYCDVTTEGRIDLDMFRNAMNGDTVYVSIMHVNNETGVIQPIEEISNIIRSVSKKCVFHVDCVQSFCKIPVNPRKMGADMVSVSAHKIHAFKGCGALYTGGKRIIPVIYGGEQQNELRPGTENVGGILAFGAAAAAAKCDCDEMRKKRILMKEELIKHIENIEFNGSDEYNSGSVLNVSFPGIKAEILLHTLERHGIYVSTGSACSSHKPQPSHVLTAMGVSPKSIAGAIRISFSEYTTEAEIKESAEKIAAEAAAIRKFM